MVFKGVISTEFFKSGKVLITEYPKQKKKS